MHPITALLLALTLAGCAVGGGVGTATVSSAPDGSVDVRSSGYRCGVTLPGPPRAAGCAPSAGSTLIRPAD
ncbi:hypothetical protein [Methylobrevis albus]|uniref:Lipoprotein n=1 Tax=Methylobrevis albus TaxID=2793297 RepID=A0A931I1S8_9HYPH|nr:hypothetical protein [Methylobrevis albus]MBH0237381.1 hypothetical protein [Methylobrevis albus]